MFPEPSVVQYFTTAVQRRVKRVKEKTIAAQHRTQCQVHSLWKATEGCLTMRERKESEQQEKHKI